MSTPLNALPEIPPPPMSRYSLSFAALVSPGASRLAPCTPTVTEPNTVMSSLPSAASAPAAANRFATSMGTSLDFIGSLLAQEELAAHRRGIVAVDVRMAVQARQQCPGDARQVLPAHRRGIVAVDVRMAVQARAWLRARA